MTKIEWAIVAVVVVLIVGAAILWTGYRYEIAERLDCLIDQQFISKPTCT